MIWCVEDDSSIRDIEIYTLQSTGFEAKGFEDAGSCLKALQSERPDLILLDVMLPQMDGVELLRKIRATASLRDIPIIMATAKGSEYDKVQCLDIGADDYLVKPFGMMEMVSRVKARLRRCRTNMASDILQVRGLLLDLNGRTVSADGEGVVLTYKEFEILKLFMQNPGKVFTRDVMYSEIWEDNFYGETRTVDVHIRTLRQKLGKYGDLIKTVRNVGYRMEVK